MNALVDGKVLPIDEAIALRRKQLADRGVTQPRVRFSDGYAGRLPNYLARDTETAMSRLQAALLR